MSVASNRPRAVTATPALSFALAFAALLIVGERVAASDDASGAPPAIVLRAAETNRLALQGAIANDRHIDVTLQAGPVHYTEHNDARVLMKDGSFVHVDYTRIVKNGRELSADEMAARQKETDQDLARGLGFFKRPYDKRYVSDYDFDTNGIECTCPPGAIAVRFRSRVRDDQHGDGTFEIDSRTARVLSLVYAPNVLPEHANQSTIVERYGEPLPGLWTTVGVERRYGGRVALFSGNGVVMETLDHFSRLADRPDGATK